MEQSQPNEQPGVLGLDQERSFLCFGPIWGEAPPLHTWSNERGRSAAIALDALLTTLEEGGLSSREIRELLAACYDRMDRPVELHALHRLSADNWQQMRCVLEWVQLAGGLRLDDFADGGARFLRLVLRKRPQTIARLVAGAAA